jgi:hypothetical protein
MSKSAENDASRINLTDTPDIIRQKVSSGGLSTEQLVFWHCKLILQHLGLVADRLLQPAGCIWGSSFCANQPLCNMSARYCRGDDDPTVPLSQCGCCVVQIKRCKTDSVPALEWGNPERPEATNLLTLYQLSTGAAPRCLTADEIITKREVAWPFALNQVQQLSTT